MISCLNVHYFTFTYIGVHLLFCCPFLPVERDPSETLHNPFWIFTTWKNLLSSTYLVTSLLILNSNTVCIHTWTHTIYFIHYSFLQTLTFYLLLSFIFITSYYNFTFQIRFLVNFCCYFLIPSLEKKQSKIQKIQLEA